MKIPREAADSIIGILEDAILEDPVVPEADKVGILLGRSTREVKRKLDNAFYNFAYPYEDEQKNESMLESRKALLEYLELMTVGLDSFLTAHPVPEAPRDAEWHPPFKRS